MEDIPPFIFYSGHCTYSIHPHVAKTLPCDLTVKNGNIHFVCEALVICLKASHVNDFSLGILTLKLKGNAKISKNTVL